MDTIAPLQRKFKLQKQTNITIQSNVFFLQVSSTERSLEEFIFPGWSAPEIFGNDNPVKVEYCSGNGAWIAHKAESNPHINWVGVEYKFSRVQQIYGHMRRKNLQNLFLINGEAFEATLAYFPDSSISGVYINFPDPWPKRRHAKNRLVSDHFTVQLARIMKPEAQVLFVTDNAEYSEWALDIFKRMENRFEPCYPHPHFIVDLPDYGNSFFDTLWREKGMTIRYHQFKRLA